MNWSRGFLRLWLIASLLWVAAVVGIGASSGTSFKRYEIEIDGKSHTVSAPSYMTHAEIVRGFQSGTLPQPEPFPLGLVVTFSLTPPAAVLVLGFLLGWIGSGFKVEAAP